MAHLIEILGEAKSLRGPPEPNDDCIVRRLADNAPAESGTTADDKG